MDLPRFETLVRQTPTTERAGNLYAGLAERLGSAPPAIAASSLHAVSCRALRFRNRRWVEAGEHVLAVGSPLPTLPLWLNDQQYVALELEKTCEDACKGLRIPRECFSWTFARTVWPGTGGELASETSAPGVPHPPQLHSLHRVTRISTLEFVSVEDLKAHAATATPSGVDRRLAWIAKPIPVRRGSSGGFLIGLGITQSMVVVHSFAG